MLWGVAGITRQLWDLIAFMVMGVFGLKALRPQALRSLLDRKIQRRSVGGYICLGHFHCHCGLKLGSLA